MRIHGQTYLCSGIRLRQWPNTGEALYILYPESLWRDAALAGGLAVAGAGRLAGAGLADAGPGTGPAVEPAHPGIRTANAADRGRRFQPHAVAGRDDEIRDLTRSVNEMAGQLAQFQKTAQWTEHLHLLGQVSGGLAHQLRNGLTGARLAVQLYLREAPATTDASALEVALAAIDASGDARQAFPRPGRTGPLRPEPCSLTALASEAVDLLRPQCRHAGIDLVWQPSPDPLTVAGDPGQLGQLIVNLLGNAIDAAGPGGSVEIRGGALKGELFLEVVDTGPGPPEELADRLFEPFVTGKPEGVGLGLAVARQVAEGHGGRIAWFRRDARTCFRVDLPTAA